MMISCLVALTGLIGADEAVAQPPVEPLLPLHRGQLVVSLGPPGQWLPESGTPTSLTLLSGAPRSPRAVADNAYIALQRTTRACGHTPARDREPLRVIPAFYAHHDLISAQPGSPYAGAQAGDYAAAVSGIVITESKRVRACVWIASGPTSRGLASSYVIRLLNGLFAASVSTLPNAGTSADGAYTLDAIDVGREFAYAVTTLQCGDHYRDASSAIPDGQLASDSVAIETYPCAGDGSTYAFTRVGGRKLATLTYTETQATAPAPEISSAGGCELDPLTVVPLDVAGAYLQAVGCRIGRLLIAPYERAFPLGAVMEAQVDGGLAEVAPAGTAVDLELNGRPSPTVSRHVRR
jgi:hypothetical protein